MMNKPSGVVSATEDAVEETVVDLLEEEDRAFSPFPVGRLDKDTEGLLLLTNDGQLAHQLLSPKKHVPKTYFAVVDGEVTEADVAAFQRGVVLDDGYETKPAKLVVLKSGLRSDVEVTITEGKFHQVKRMFQAVGKRVVYLKRIQMGPLPLDPDLAVGEYRELTDEEVDMLKQYRPETDEKKEPDAVPFLWKNSGYSSVEKWFAFISHLAYPIGTGFTKRCALFCLWSSICPCLG
ncbi:Ribosomal small subunit pseudouridine synthase A [Geobacillus stearothermophilus]|uniref:Pseudouridine synthase n=1 Tax=Geobacillus stearothermophilus TaxID=1422 RepID=A0ABQ7HEG5_GEOSE|nr:Ribosomal small subunit pseudouridine synthase A [Geobacillus stearothermophilus]